MLGDTSDLFEHVYDKLRVLAGRYFRNQPTSGTLQATALVHETYVRLAQQQSSAFRDREHFLAVAATAMRQIAIDYARRRKAAKRGGDCERISLSDTTCGLDTADSNTTVDVLEVDRLITRLSGLSPRQARIVELRVFAGMTIAEVASVLCVSVATVEKEWRQARAWMRLELNRNQPS